MGRARLRPAGRSIGRRWSGTTSAARSSCAPTCWRASRLALLGAVVLAPWIADRTRAMQRDVDALRARLPDPQLAQTIGTHLRSATATQLDGAVFDALFGKWQGAQGQALYLRNPAQFDEEHTREPEPRLGAIDVPVRVSWGELDAWLPVEVSERIAARIPCAVREVIPGAGHFSMEDDPAAVTAALSRLLV